jgi:hypothetical protein
MNVPARIQDNEFVGKIDKFGEKKGAMEKNSLHGLRYHCHILRLRENSSPTSSSVIS